MRPGSPGHTCDFWTPILCAHTGLRNSLFKPIRPSASIIAARPMARFMGAAVAVCGSGPNTARNYRVGAHSGCGEMASCDSGLQQQAPLASIAELGRQVFIGDCRVGRTREQHHHEREGHRGAQPDEQTQPERGERIADNGEAAWMKDSASCIHFLPFAFSACVGHLNAATWRGDGKKMQGRRRFVATKWRRGAAILGTASRVYIDVRTSEGTAT
jgi:hypothetical protein